MRLWVKLFVSQGWVQAEITVNNYNISVLISYHKIYDTLNCTIGLGNLNRHKTDKTAVI